MTCLSPAQPGAAQLRLSSVLLACAHSVFCLFRMSMSEEELLERLQSLDEMEPVEDEEALIAQAGAFLDEVERGLGNDSFGGDDYDGTQDVVMTDEEVLEQLMRIDEIGWILLCCALLPLTVPIPQNDNRLCYC